LGEEGVLKKGSGLVDGGVLEGDDKERECLGKNEKVVRGRRIRIVSKVVGK
jgi:hypothetical protein